MDEKRSLILMVVFGVLIIISFYFIPMLRQDSSTQKEKELKEEKNEVIQDNNNKKNLDKFEIIETSQDNIQNLVYENDNIKIEFDPHDAIIKHAWIKDTFLKRKKVIQYDLVNSENNMQGALRVKFGKWDSDITLSNLTGGNNLYNYERVGDKFIFKCNFKKIDDDTIYTIEKTYQFIENENIFKLTVNILNNNNKSISKEISKSNVAFSVGWGPFYGIEARDKIDNKRHENKFSYFDGKNIKSITAKDKIFKKNGERSKFSDELDSASWIASNGHYFAAAIYPDNNNYNYFFDYRDMDNNNYYCGLTRRTDNTEVNSSFYIYIGPKIGTILNDADKAAKKYFKLSDTNFAKLNERIIFYIGNGIEYILNIIYNIVHNYGLAIIILTILIKIILFPLTFKSLESQQKMSKLQPKLKELQEKYKQSPEVLNKETMKLYKKEGVNPLGGCLPMLLQMPILFAMYKLLNRMVALKGADFLWIKDLSLPDAIINFNFNIPFLNISSLNILPIIMVGTQILTSLLTPGSKENKQAMYMMWGLPIVFFFIFYNVSSGLVLYWTIMNILGIIQQIITNRIKKQPKPA